jgi:hypothetical protein
MAFFKILLTTRSVADYYDILQNIVEYMFDGAKELKVVFFQCDLFDPINDTIQGAIFFLHIRCNMYIT